MYFTLQPILTNGAAPSGDEAVGIPINDLRITPSRETGLSSSLEAEQRYKNFALSYFYRTLLNHQEIYVLLNLLCILCAHLTFCFQFVERNGLE